MRVTRSRIDKTFEDILAATFESKPMPVECCCDPVRLFQGWVNAGCKKHGYFSLWPDHGGRTPKAGTPGIVDL